MVLEIELRVLHPSEEEPIYRLRPWRGVESSEIVGNEVEMKKE